MPYINAQECHQDTASSTRAKIPSSIPASLRTISSPAMHPESPSQHYSEQWSEVEDALKDFTAPTPTCPRTAQDFKQQWRQVLDRLEEFPNSSPPKTEVGLRNERACESEAIDNHHEAVAPDSRLIFFCEPMPSADHEGDGPKARLAYLRDLFGIETPWRRSDLYSN